MGRPTRSAALPAPTTQTQESQPAHPVRLATTVWRTPPPTQGATVLLATTVLREPHSHTSSPAVLALTMHSLVSALFLSGIRTEVMLRALRWHMCSVGAYNANTGEYVVSTWHTHCCLQGKHWMWFPCGIQAVLVLTMHPWVNTWCPPAHTRSVGAYNAATGEYLVCTWHACCVGAYNASTCEHIDW